MNTTQATEAEQNAIRSKAGSILDAYGHALRERMQRDLGVRVTIVTLATVDGVGDYAAGFYVHSWTEACDLLSAALRESLRQRHDAGECDCTPVSDCGVQLQ